jgi:hypothetical protein
MNMMMMIKIAIARFKTSAKQTLFLLSFYSCSCDWRMISVVFGALLLFALDDF